jgi:NAD(P)H-dependent FMN reductase
VGHDLELNRAHIAAYADRLVPAEGLILVYPVWNEGFPAILKGFFDRVFIPGVSFTVGPDGALVQSAQSAAGALLVQLEWDLMGIAAALHTEAGVADRWEEAGVTVAELSEQLLMSAKGIKASVETLAAYRERMLTAIRIVMRGETHA